MKTVYLRVLNNIDGYELVSATCYKEYPNLGIAIARHLPTSNEYILVDTATGYYCGKRFKKLMDARLFLESDSDDLNDWYKHVEDARNTERYKRSIIK